MGNLIKAAGVRTWKPFVSWFLRKPRKFSFGGINVRVVPGVFHPGFFFSTKQLISYLDAVPLEGKRLLEVGSGSGIVSIFAAKKGAKVTAVDISHEAVACTSDNALRNRKEIIILRSNLFENVPAGDFDIIAVNPPFYKKDPVSPADHAWNAGKNLDYFIRFFKEAKPFVHPKSKIIMVLSDECDLDGIRRIAESENWQYETVEEQKNIFGTGYIINLVLHNLSNA